MRKKYAVFTMDVEAFTDTECVANSSHKVDLDLLDGFDEYIDILDKYNIKSTLFTVGSLAPKMLDRLKKSLNNGHKLALHSYEHIAPMDVNLDTFREETLKSKLHFEKLFDIDVVGFRAPYFSLDDKRLRILKELGFKYDSSHLGFSRARHTVGMKLKNFKEFSKGIFHDGDFFEFSMSKHKIFGKNYPISGGGYVRLFNWGVIKTVIKQYLQQNDYYVFYLHPFELTRQKIPYLKDLKLYDQYYLQCGIKAYKRHIEQLIILLKKQGYDFITFEELSETLQNTIKA
jgi:peptidoglycan/xylan/chitin deacetylase (PgdA/CDA1 family)